MNKPLISIVTPVYNRASFLEETIVSVLSQGYRNIEYIIIDGGSTDGSIEIIKKYEDRLKYWSSEPDKGMYDAINKGFSHSTGDIYAWINSDDTYLPGALEVMAEAFSRYPEFDWFHGRSIYTAENGEILEEGALPLFHQSALANGYYGLFAHFVQQHCCFWRAGVWQMNGPIPTTLRYAGDYWLWTRFARQTPLISIDFPVATFRRHSGQLHKQEIEYRREMIASARVSTFSVRVRRALRRLARGTDVDTRVMDLINGMPPYRWINPGDNYALNTTRLPRLKHKSCDGEFLNTGKQ